MGFKLFFKQNKRILKINILLKFIYSEKATKFCDFSTVDLTVTKGRCDEFETGLNVIIAIVQKV